MFDTMFQAKTPRSAPASPLTAEQKRNRFWWGRTNPTPGYKRLLIGFIAFEAVSVGTFLLNRMVG